MMEAAEYIRDEQGKARSVRMDISEYEAARRRLYNSERTAHLLEAVFIDFIKTTKESGVNFYEVATSAQKRLLDEGRDPGYVEELGNFLEDLEARIALDEDTQTLTDEDFVDFETFKREADSERDAD